MADSGRFSAATCSVDMRFEEGELQRAVSLLRSVKGDILTKRGCRSCDVAVDVADAGVLHYREEWESDEASHQHARSEEFRRVLITVYMSCEEPRVVVGNLEGHSGLACLRALLAGDGR